MLTRCSLTGTFTGTTWAGTDANGHSLDVDAVLFLRLEDGFVIEMDEICDSAVVADQLGFRPGDRSRHHGRPQREEAGPESRRGP